MRCDIVVRTYWRDRPWLELCLRSIRRYASDFGAVIVVVPRGDQPWFAHFDMPVPGLRWESVPDFADDYLGQQVTKLYADQLTDAELICHVDADCLFRRPATPDDVAPGGVPRIFTRPVAELPRSWPWTAPTEELLGERPTHDFMQVPPFVFPRWLYGELRTFTESTTGVTLADWVRSRPPRGFSEFNALGGYAYAHHRDRFTWVRAADLGAEEAVVDWHWSREPPDPALVAAARAMDGRTAEPRAIPGGGPG